MRNAIPYVVPLVLCATLLVAGCSNTEKGAVGGAVIGGALGGIIGNQSGNAGQGAAIGAFAGALTGALVGNMIDESERKNQAVYSRQETIAARPEPYQESDGVVVEILETRFDPPRVRAGGELEVAVRYRVLAPTGQSVKITEDTEVRLPSSADEPPRRFEPHYYFVESGTYNLSRVINLPSNSPEGIYEVRTKLRAGTSSVDSAAGTFRVVFE